MLLTPLELLAAIVDCQPRDANTLPLLYYTLLLVDYGEAGSSNPFAVCARWQEQEQQLVKTISD